MPYIFGQETYLQDRNVLTRYQGIVYSTSRTYTFKTMQDTVRFMNSGPSSITVTIDGTNNVIASGTEKTLTNVESFDIVSAGQTQTFMLESWASAVSVWNVLSFKHKVVGLGSSTMYGEGSSTINTTNTTSWMAKLKVTLSSMGIELINKGIGGNDTTDGINRFYTDVVPYKPDVCLIGFTLMNEGWTPGGGIGPNMDIYDQFKANILKLANMCRQNNIIPIIISQFPNDSYDADLLRAAKQLNREIEQLGLPQINFMGGLLDPSIGKIIQSVKVDAYHHNDTGHDADYKSINPSTIEYLAALKELPRIPYTQGATRRGATRYPATTSDATGGDAIMFVPDYTVDSFTVFVRLKQTVDMTAAKTLLGLGSAGWRVSNVANATTAIVKFVNAAGSDVGVSTVDLNDNQEHSICITYNKILQTVKFYMDGALVATGTSASITLDQVGLGCRGTGTIYPDNVEYWDCAVYRTCLDDDQVKDMHRGRFPIGSLELLCPMDDVAVGLYNRFNNYAPTKSKLKIKTSTLISV